MEFRDLVAKFYEEKKSVEPTVESTVAVKESTVPSFKKVFEELSSKKVVEAQQLTIEPAKQSTQVIKKGNEVIGSVSNPALAATIKSAIGKGEMSLAGTQMKEAELDEKWAGNAKVKPTGQYKDKTKEELKSMLAKLHKSGPHDKDSPAAKKMRQINFALRAKGGWKSGEGAAMKEEQIDEKAKNPYAIGMAAAKKAAGITKKHATDLPKSVVVKGHEIAKKIQKKEQTNEAEIASTKSQDTMGAALGAGRSDVAFESIQVSESMNKKHRAAYQEGQADGLRERACRVKHYEDMEEAKHYYEGYKSGLDECYGMGVKNEPIVGMEEAIDAMEAGMGEGNAFTAALAKTDKGDTFKVGGNTYKDTSNYDAKLDELAFESFDKQLNALLNEDVEASVTEGLTVSMSSGQKGVSDSVSVTGTDDEAGKLLAFIKQVGLGGMGAEKAEEPAVIATVSDYGAPKFSGDNADMKALLQKVGVDSEGHDHKHGEPCNECGMMEGCGCDKKESVDEVMTPDQTLYATTSESDNSEDDGYDASARNTELDNIGKPAFGGATNEDGAEAPGSNPVGQAEQEEAEAVSEESTEKMDHDAEKAAEKVKKDIEYDDKKDREHGKLDEWANNAGQKGTDTSFEQDIEFMTKVIAGGLNKPKVTGQTTIPVIASQDARNGEKEDLNSWIKLAGVKPAVKK